MGGGVDEPSDVKDEGVAEECGDEEGVGPCLVPHVDRDDRGEDEAGQRHEDHVVSEKKMVVSWELIIQSYEVKKIRVLLIH